jgi:hypothetical protein
MSAAGSGGQATELCATLLSHNFRKIRPTIFDIDLVNGLLKSICAYDFFLTDLVNFRRTGIFLQQSG